MALSEGDKAPAFNLPSDGGKNLKLSDYKGKKLVLYFYPKDDTPGCTKEAIGFSEDAAKFKRAGAVVIGASKDTVAKHEKFRDKYGLKIPLVSDEDGSLCDDYGVWTTKMNYGKSYMGIERSTFLIDEKGKIAKVWRKVKVDGHVEAVLEALKAL
ncbi:MAG: thioredoxin-dependent thiol peroxidase [Proteobacteria bacterium]|nr:thioredoxin-dependent thiol peroxidase [Pseudomonadota bacterium]MDA1058168.1 thioredoxin-dependent thiol peroxidase [Pseudomonadota bacterium]